MVNLLRVFMELVSLGEMVMDDDIDDIDLEDAEDPCECAELSSNCLE
ncbi:MAG: hypothetical protein OXT74_01970 [Candidatus Poribacteria bacterium]|nr:hypothetical protein [Candidatus Poribacteria bacterium]